MELIWKPTVKQEEFLSLPFDIFEALYGGSVGCGKSELLVIAPLAYEFHLHPKFKGLILRRTYPELEREIVVRSETYYAAAGAKYNRQEKVWRFPSGARIFFGHAENESDIRRYDGVEYNYVAYDELTSFTKFQYLYIAASRCRSATADLPAIVRSSGMPGGVGNEWVRRRFVEPDPLGGKVIVDPVTGQKRFFLRAEPRDNKYLLDNDPGYLDRLALLPEAERKMKLGDWYIFSGQVFSDFRIEPLPDEPDNARHVIEPFDIPEWWPKVVAVDWGFKANTVALWAAMAPNGRVYVYQEYVVSETPVAEWATEIGDLTRREKNVKLVVLDSNAWEQRGETETIAEQFERFSGLRPEPASKGRISGKILVQEYLRWRQKPRPAILEEFNPRLAELILKTRGQEAYNEYLMRFTPEPEESNLPKLQIFSNCKELIRVIPLCVYDTKQVEDVAEFEGDDAYDCLRYLLKAIIRYQDQSSQTFRNLQKYENMVRRLEQTRDYTSFAIAQSILNHPKSFGVKRFHKGMRKMQTPLGIFGD